MLYIIVLHTYAFFEKLKFHATLDRASLSAPFINQDLLTSFLCIIFSCNTVNLIDKCVFLLFYQQTLPGSPPHFSLGLLYSLRQSNIEIRPINNPVTAFEYSSERKNYMVLTVNQKLEISLVGKACRKPCQAQS